MLPRWLGVVLFLAVAATASGAEPLAAAARRLLSEAPAVAGVEDWLFAMDELQALAQAPPTEEQRRKRGSVMADLQRQLHALNIELILLPVPLKAAVYAEKWAPEADPQPFFAAYAEMLDAWRLEGVRMVDLSMEVRDTAGKNQWYCRRDSHWSNVLVVLAAQKVAREIQAMPWYAGEEREKFTAETERISFAGDLALALEGNASGGGETQSIRRIKGGAVGENALILLVGDSHTLIFGTGRDMLSNGAGLAEQMAYELGLPVERIGVRQGGGTSVWKQVFRRSIANREWLTRKKVVVWCFSAREFFGAEETWIAGAVNGGNDNQVESK